MALLRCAQPGPGQVHAFSVRKAPTFPGPRTEEMTCNYVTGPYVYTAHFI